jgi:hypothetical protein
MRIRIRIELLISVRIRTQGDKPVRIRILISHKKLNFYMKIYLKFAKGKKHTYKGTKAFFKGRKPGLLVSFGQFHASGSGSAFPIRIRIQNKQMNADPDP